MIPDLPFKGLLQLTVLALSLSAISPAEATPPLRYGAYWAGAQVGEAEVHIHLTDDSYSIQGRAWTLGLVRTATRWRGDFGANGRITEEGQPIPEAYAFSTRRRGDRTRGTQMRDGQVETHRDGRSRNRGPAPEGLDMLTALFLPGECGDFEKLHTGLSFYQLVLLNQRRQAAQSRQPAIDHCEFDVVDDDGDSYRVTVEVADYGSRRIPIRIDIGGFLTGSVRLLEMPSFQALDSPMAGRED